MSEELDAKQSLCWLCKFGLCIQETDQERLYHPNIRNLLNDSSPTEKIFDMEMDESPEEGDEEMVEHIIPVNRVKAICYWRPPGIENTPPVLVANVKKCNRFEIK